MPKQWIVAEISPRARELSRRYGINEIIAHLLLRRNVEPEEFESFLNPDIAGLHPPHLLPDIDKAVQRIRQAINAGEKICLFGDYDVDGITSLTIIDECLKRFSARTFFYIPHRVNEGYGLNSEAIHKIREQGATLLICLDCGTNSSREISLAGSLGMDVIVADHHLPARGENIPLAFVNPKRKDSTYPFKDLSGAGVAFKLAQALSGDDCRQTLDLVALSVVCDVVPLKGENRIMLVEGLSRLRTTSRISIQALCEVARVRQETLEPFHLGFILGPRINACGRMAHAEQVLELFTCRDREYARQIAQRLDEYNRLRKSVEQSILKEAEELIVREFQDDAAFVLSKEGWHQGVLGIVASRLADKYWRPTFVIGVNEGKGRGSARSIPGLHLMEVLDTCKETLHSYGGHKKAAGVEIGRDNIADFRDQLNAALKQLAREKPLPEIQIDAELSLSQLSMELAEGLERLRPFGEENSHPLFVTRGLLPKTAVCSHNSRVNTFWLCDDSLTYEAVVYGRDECLDLVRYKKPLDVVYSLEKNHYHNTFRLVVKDMRLS